ncbi:MAG TPA: pyruvate dehydrogenase (acetyl-transferring), homodimeric type, partial [Paraburkholderia sp.]|nr:pyruvate dehydrogenase (acetyl-transferring), homodimeric type [Paraburkholderia sp.]
APIQQGMYLLPAFAGKPARVQLLGSGAILGEVLAAARLLADDWGIDAAVWSVTSFTELQRDGIEAERRARLAGAALDTDGAQAAYVTAALGGAPGPVIAATDYVRAVPELIRAYVPARYVTLGTDGFGRSDTRSALREFFEVDRASIAIAALQALADDGAIDRARVREALARYRPGHAEGGASRAPWQR